MPTAATGWTVDLLNAAPDGPALRNALRECCAAESWIDRVIRDRPYPDEAALAVASDAATADLDDDALAQALAGHPRIGDRTEVRRDTAPHRWSADEQSGMAIAAAEVRGRMAEANLAYESRFGHVYLVCASGRSATELLSICESRLANNPSLERSVVISELAKINRLRLAKLCRTDELEGG